MNLLTRFMRYTAVGGISTAFDFFLIWFFTSVLGFFYLLSGALGFSIAHSCNYIVNREINYKNTKRSLREGYAYFITFGLLGLGATLGLLAFFVEVTHVPYLLARILAAIIVGIASFVINTKVTFKTPLVTHKKKRL